LTTVELLGCELAPNAAALTCRHVIAGSPVSLVSHDDDGMIQALCGLEHVIEDAVVVSARELLALCPALAELPSMTPGTTVTLART